MKILGALALGFLSAAQPVWAGEPSFDLNFGKGEVKQLKVSDFEAIYVDRGQGTPIVLFHPAIDYRGWQKQFPELAKSHRVIAISYRVDEHLPMPGDLSDPSMLTATLQALETKSKLGPVDLVAHSMGGLQAMRMAVSHPELVRRLVLEEPGADPSKGIPHCTLTGVSKLELGLCNKESLLVGPGHYEASPETYRQFRLEGQQAELKAIAAAQAAGIKPQPLPDVCTEISKITAPTLFIRGANTPAALQVGLDHYEECLPKHGRLVLPHATHWGHLDDPEDFNRAVLDFIEKD